MLSCNSRWHVSTIAIVFVFKEEHKPLLSETTALGARHLPRSRSKPTSIHKCLQKYVSILKVIQMG
jgi:hypothetical protein